MALQYKFFMVPAKGNQDVENEMNQFMNSCRVTHIQREWIANGENSFWSIVVEHESVAGQAKAYGKSYGKRIDYREILSPDDFALFANLRDWRKEKSEKENSKAYVICTDAQLAKIVEKRPSTNAGLLEIDGIGEGRVEKYGEDMLRIIAGAQAGEQKTDEK